MLTGIRLKTSTKLYENDWCQLEKEIKTDIGTDTLEYCRYMLMSNWKYLKAGRLEMAMGYAAEAEETGIRILSENDEMKIRIYYILSVITLQQNDLDRSMFYRKYGENILKNRYDLSEDYADWVE